jgi:tRNA nucleotidyltransferase/poly(A) polymerase
MQAFENHIQWSAVKDVCRRLKESGYQVLLAGGCVRDLLMNRTPNDFDVATNATPDQVEELFPKAVTVGKAFGVTILPFEGFQVEVTTFRQDLGSKDGRRPEGVKFSTPEEDAKRRDFTVNALFLDPDTKQVTDFVGGQKDIEDKVIRTVGDPNKRFDEDKLRILRAVRFAAQLDFEIATDTFEAVIDRACEVQIVSRERIRDEMTKLFKAHSMLRGLELLLSSGLLAPAFPALAPHVFASETLWLKRFEVLTCLCGMKAPDPVAAFALFFMPAHESLGEKEFRDSCLKDLRLDNKLIESVAFVLKSQEALLRPESQRLGRLVQLLARPEGVAAELVASVLERDGAALKGLAERTERENRLSEIRKERLSSSGSAPEPYLSGADAKTEGVAAGPEMGKLLGEAYLLQLEGQLDSREAAIKWLKGQV